MVRLDLFLRSACLAAVLVGSTQGCPAANAQGVSANIKSNTNSNGDLLEKVQEKAILQGPISRPVSLIVQLTETPQQPSLKSFLQASNSLTRLIEQHDCKAHFADSNPVIESISRHKVAALLFSCLENWNRQTFNPQERADLKTLLSEFKLELVALKGSSAAEPLLTSVNLPDASVLTAIGNQPGSEAVAFRPTTSQNADYEPSDHTVGFSTRSLGRVSLSVNFGDQFAMGGQAFSVNAEANVGNLGLFGRYDTTRSETSRSGPTQAWTVGIGLRSFIIPHALLAISARRLGEVENVTQPVQMSYGAFYQFPLTERLTIAPSIVIKPHPKNLDQNLDVQGALQATFSF